MGNRLDIRMLQLYNAGTIQIESFSPMETMGKHGTLSEISVRVPTAASMSQLLVNGPSPIPAGSSGAIPDNWPRWVGIKHETLPAIGASIGSVASGTAMTAGNTGFLCLAVDGTSGTGGALALARPFASAGGPEFYTCDAWGIRSYRPSSGETSRIPGPLSALSMAGSITSSSWSLQQLEKSSAGNYYLSVQPPDSKSFYMFKSTIPSASWNDISGSSVVANSNRAIYSAPNGGVFVASLTKDSAGTNLQIMEYSGLAGTWGTALITADNVMAGQGGMITYSYNWHQRGPWHGGLAIASLRTIQGVNPAPSENRIPIYDGTSWTYASIPMRTSGTYWQDGIYPTQVASEANGDYVWANGYHYESYGASGISSMMSWDKTSWTYFDYGTSNYFGFTTDPGGGLIAVKESQYGTSLKVQFLRCKAGSFVNIGNIIESSASMGGRAPILAYGNWSGSNIGGLYVAVTTQTIRLQSGTSIINGIVNLPEQNGTTLSTWRQYGIYGIAEYAVGHSALNS